MIRLAKLGQLSLVLTAALMGFGCVVSPDQIGDETDGNEPVLEVQQAFNGYWSYSWQVHDQITAPADLGLVEDKTCFLTGVDGNFESQYSVGSPGPWPAPIDVPPHVEVYKSGGHWKLNAVATNSTHAVKVTAMCVPWIGGTGLPAKSWSTGLPPQVLGAAVPGRRCFLQGISNFHDDWDHSTIPSTRATWSSSSDSVQVWNDGTNWVIGGTGQAEGSAACIDVTAGFGSWTWIAGTGTSTQNLVQHSDSTVQCFLTGVGGRFRTTSYSDGVNIGYVIGTTQWTSTQNDGKTAWSSCVQ